MSALGGAADRQGLGSRTSARLLAMARPSVRHIRAWANFLPFEPRIPAARPTCMSNRTFLIVVSAVILAAIGSLAVQKWEACMEHGGKACPKTRFYVPDANR